MKLNVCRVVLLFHIIVLVRSDDCFRRHGLVFPLDGRFLDLFIRLDEKEAILLSKQSQNNGTFHLERIDSKFYPENFPLDYREWEFTANYLNSNESMIICRNQFDDKPPCVLLPIVFSIDPKAKAKFGEYTPIVSRGEADFDDQLRKQKKASNLFRMFSKDGRYVITTSVHGLTKLRITRKRIDFEQKVDARRAYLTNTGSFGASFEPARIFAFESRGYAYFFRSKSSSEFPHYWYLTRICLDDSSRELMSQMTIALRCHTGENYSVSGPMSAAYFDRDVHKLYVYMEHGICEFSILTVASVFEDAHRRCYEEFSDEVVAYSGQNIRRWRPCSDFKPTNESMEGLGTPCMHKDTCNPPKCTKMYNLGVNKYSFHGELVSQRYESASTAIDFIVVSDRKFQTKQAFLRTPLRTMFLSLSIDQPVAISSNSTVPRFTVYESKSCNTQLVEMADQSGFELIDGDRLISFKFDCSLYTECRQLLNDANSEQARRLWKCGWCKVHDDREFSANESECSKRGGFFLKDSCLPVVAKCLESQRWLSNETRKLTIHGDFPSTFDYMINVCGSECRDIERLGHGAQVSLTCFSTPPYPQLTSSSKMSSCGVKLIVLEASNVSILIRSFERVDSILRTRRVLTTLRPESCGGPMHPPTISPPSTTGHPPTITYISTSTPPLDQYPPTDYSDKSGWYVSAGIITFLIIVGVAYFLCRTRKRRSENRRRRADESALPMVGPPDLRCDHDHDYVQPRSQTENAQHIRPITHGNYEDLSHVVPSQLLIQNELLKAERLVGEGHFGKVFKAIYTPVGAELSIQVAVKTLLCKENARQFLREGMLMETFEHWNVLSLIGISFEDDLPMIITPFMTKGDLLSYIRHPHNSPDITRLLTFGLEIAAGMQYLHKSKFIHRDLAARNCMLDENLRVKVADFGLSRDVYETEAYTSSQSMPLPIRWMPPESIELKVYSYKSDVWSYGVVLWELCTRGKIPYAGRSGFEVLSYLKSGHRLERFDTTPEEVNKLMRACWMLVPDERPDFMTLVERLSVVIDRLKSTVLPVPLYYNTVTLMFGHEVSIFS